MTKSPCKRIRRRFETNFSNLSVSWLLLFILKQAFKYKVKQYASSKRESLTVQCTSYSLRRIRCHRNHHMYCSEVHFPMVIPGEFYMYYAVYYTINNILLWNRTVSYWNKIQFSKEISTRTNVEKKQEETNSITETEENEGETKWTMPRKNWSQSMPNFSQANNPGFVSIDNRLYSTRYRPKSVYSFV